MRITLPLGPETPITQGDALFAEAIRSAHARCARPILVGLCGAQGSGKSTMAARLRERLTAMDLAVAVCSLDDFYLSHADRHSLAATVHPLFATRGVPGTHDIPLLRQTIDALRTARPGDATPLPAFDKASDDRVPEPAWPHHSGRADIILLEGWCVGATAEDEAALAQPVNALERDEDADGIWGTTVNASLARDYAPLFARLGLRLMLRAPSFDCVHRWRMEQELGLARTAGARPPMDAAALHRFIAHYERITRHLLRTEPADLIADLDADRISRQWRDKRTAPAPGL